MEGGGGARVGVRGVAQIFAVALLLLFTDVLIEEWEDEEYSVESFEQWTTVEEWAKMDWGKDDKAVIIRGDDGAEERIMAVIAEEVKSAMQDRVQHFVRFRSSDFVASFVNERASKMVEAMNEETRVAFYTGGLLVQYTGRLEMDDVLDALEEYVEAERAQLVHTVFRHALKRHETSFVVIHEEANELAKAMTGKVQSWMPYSLPSVILPRKYGWMDAYPGTYYIYHTEFNEMFPMSEFLLDSIGEEGLAAFLTVHGRPYIEQWPYAADEIHNMPIDKVALYFYDGDSDHDWYPLKEVSKDMRAYVIIAKVNASDPSNNHTLEHFRVDPNVLPTMRAYDKHATLMFTPRTGKRPLSVEDCHEFVKSLIKGDAFPVLESEKDWKLEEERNGVVVDISAEQLLHKLRTVRTAIVLFHSQQCTKECTKALELMQQIAGKRGDETCLFARIDADSNQMPMRAPIRGFPTIVAIRMNEGTKEVEMEADLTLENLDDFVKENMKTEGERMEDLMNAFNRVYSDVKEGKFPL